MHHRCRLTITIGSRLKCDDGPGVARMTLRMASRACSSLCNRSTFLLSFAPADARYCASVQRRHRSIEEKQRGKVSVGQCLEIKEEFYVLDVLRAKFGTVEQHMRVHTADEIRTVQPRTMFSGYVGACPGDVPEPGCR